jgi:hypothetical protein
LNGKKIYIGVMGTIVEFVVMMNLRDQKGISKDFMAPSSNHKANF